MTSTTHRDEFTATLYVGVELSKREWWLTMSAGPGQPVQRARVAPGAVPAITTAVGRATARLGLPAGVAVRSCSEAGFDGFWPARVLLALGWTHLVVDSSSIEVPRRARRAKTDRLDGEKLLRMLQRYWGGERDVWRVVRVPSPAEEDGRHASRALTTLQQDRTRYRNRIHGLLALVGVRLRLDGRLPERLTTVRTRDGAPVGPGLQARVLEQWRLLQAVEQEVRTREAADAARVAAAATPSTAVAQRLTQLRGLGTRAATVLADELLTRDLRNRRQVGALCGLVSAPYASGSEAHDQGLMPGGLPAVRRLAIQVAWGWRRYQRTSALTRWYERRFGHGSAGLRRVGLVALARRLVIALWRYATTGVVPEGAVLKA